MAGKITDYPTTTVLIDEDLFDLSKYDGVSAYATNAITWEDILKEIQIDLTFNNIYNNNGTIGTGRTATLTDSLSFVSGQVIAAASAAGYASLNIPSGVDPTVPVDGDLWFNGTNLYFRDGATSIDLLGGDGNGIYDGSGTLTANTTVTNAGFDLSITGTGNFGIGTATPTEKLEVVGNAKISGNVGVGVTSTKIMQLNSTNAADEISLMASGTILSRLAYSTTHGGYIQLHNSTGVITEVLIGFGTVDYINTTSNFALGKGTATRKLEVHSALSSNSIDLIYDGDINARTGYNSTVGGYFQLKNNDATSTRLLLGFGSDDYINTGQNLGIGLDAGITEKVHISGNIRVDGYENLTPITAPSSPANGFVIYVDSSDGDLKAKSSTGVTTTIALN